MTERDFIDSSKEKVYLFVDYANGYREAIKRHDAKLFRNNQTTAPAENRKPEVALAELLKALRKSDVSQNVISTVMDGFFKTIVLMNDSEVESTISNDMPKNALHFLRFQECKRVGKYRDQLKTRDGRKTFVEQHFPTPRFILQARSLRYICTRFKIYETLPKEQCFAFVSHRRGDKEMLENNGIFTRMTKKFTILYHERVPVNKTSEKEKGVDVNIAVHITNIICKSLAAGQPIRIVLVSGDADFKPVVEYALKNQVPMDIWAWKSERASEYERFLQDRQMLFHLDRYLYQIGFHPGIKYEYDFRVSMPVNLTEDDRVRVSGIFKTFSNYAIAKRLTEETGGPGLFTWDFQIFRRSRDFSIVFFREESRDKLESFLQNNPNDDFVNRLNQLHHEKTLHSAERMRERGETADQDLKAQKDLDNWLDDTDDDGIESTSCPEDVDEDSESDNPSNDTEDDEQW